MTEYNGVWSEIWVILSLFAAFLQFVRTAIQKRLTGSFSPILVTALRFAVGLPFAIITVLLLKNAGQLFPNLNQSFLLYILLAAIFQIIGSVMMMNLFNKRNFVVGIAYSKAETIFSAILGFLLFNEQINTYSLIAIIVGFWGVALLSLVGKINNKISWQNFFSKDSFLGIMLGVFHAATAVFVREATIRLNIDSTIVKTSYALLFMFMIQTIILTPYILKYCRNELLKLRAHKQTIFSLGFVGFLTSICWYAAYSLKNTAYVNAFGQIELIFSFLATHIIFKERIKVIEIVGVVLIAVSIVTVSLY